MPSATYTTLLRTPGAAAVFLTASTGRVASGAGHLDVRYLGALDMFAGAAGLRRRLPAPAQQVRCTHDRSGRAVSAAEQAFPAAAAGSGLPQRTALTSVGCVHTQRGRLLAVRTRRQDAFYLPGGKVEPKETLQRALVRGVHEEVGLHLAQVREAFTVRAPAHGLRRATGTTRKSAHARWTARV